MACLMLGCYRSNTTKRRQGLSAASIPSKETLMTVWDAGYDENAHGLFVWQESRIMESNPTSWVAVCGGLTPLKNPERHRKIKYTSSIQDFELWSRSFQTCHTCH